MLRGFYNAAQAMIVKQRELDAIGNNLSNINTAGYKKDEIVMNNILDLSGDSSNWACVSGYAKAGMHIGTVEKIDNLRVWTKEDDGTTDVNYYHPSINFFLEIDTQNANNPVKNISFEDISYGDTVLYNVTADGVKGVILVK